MDIEKIFLPSATGDRTELAYEIRDYLVERVNSGKTGKVSLAYVWAKSLGVLKPVVIPLLPFHDVQDHHHHEHKTKKKAEVVLPHKIIFETQIDSIVLTLASIWVHMRIFEMLNDLQIVEAAAQAHQLESAIESLSSEKKKVLIDFRKATHEQLNAAMRGVITSTNMTKAKARAKANPVYRR